MNPRRFATVAAVLAVVLAGWVVAWLAGFSSAGIDNTGAAPIVDRHPPSLTADAAVGKAVVAAAAESMAGTADGMPVASDEPESTAEAALTDSSHTLPRETLPVQVATASTPDPVPNDAQKAVSSIEIPSECLVGDICIDQYLWALYQRTPKEDSIKVLEQRKVTVKKKGKTVTVTCLRGFRV